MDISKGPDYSQAWIFSETGRRSHLMVVIISEGLCQYLFIGDGIHGIHGITVLRLWISYGPCSLLNKLGLSGHPVCLTYHCLGGLGFQKRVGSMGLGVLGGNDEVNEIEYFHLI